MSGAQQGDLIDARGRRRTIALIVVCAVALVAAVVLAIVLLRPGAGTPGAAGSSSPTPSTTASAHPTPTATLTVTPTPTPTVAPGPVATIPADCEGLYSPAMFAFLSEAASELNPPDFPGIASKLASAEAAGILEGAPGGIECHWRVHLEAGIGTEVVPVDAGTAAAVEAALAAAGYEPLQESWGTRWVIEFTDEIVRGESHTIVGGAWFATWWLGLAPDGYTADMVATIVH